MLKISNISKTFNPGTVNEKKAISGLSLHLEPGDFVTIIGSNGAGKSTLFNAIAGSFWTDGGSIVLERTSPFSLSLSGPSGLAGCFRTLCGAAPPA